jgi:nucleotide-binding universal stress UspA family protein
MEDDIAAPNAHKFCESARDYTIYIARHSNAHVVGVYLDDVTYHSHRLSDIHFTANGGSGSIENFNEKESDYNSANTIENLLGKLKTSIYRDRNIALNNLLHESLYSDLLVIYKNETLTDHEEHSPTRFVSELLAKAKCPVMVVPDTFKLISKIILLYDGKPSSVYAIKMFSCILSSFKHVEIEVLTIKDEEKTSDLHDDRFMKEYISRHFPNAIFHVLQGETEDAIMNYLKLQKKNALVVLGEHGRNSFSRLFKRNLADSLMKSVDLPLFVAHDHHHVL